MTEANDTMTETHETDSWLSAVFAAAAGPVIDMAFVDRILARIRKRQQVRVLVIGGVSIVAAALTLWLASLLATVTPALGTTSLTAPAWLTASPYAPLAVAFVLIGLTAWMFTEEA